MSWSESGIPWTEVTWNPIRGCTKIRYKDSPSACDNCYAAKLTQDAPWGSDGEWTRDNESRVLSVHPEHLDAPRDRDGRLCFTASISDIFHPRFAGESAGFVSVSEMILDVIRETPQHTYQVLTKRPHIAKQFDFPENVWLGTSIGSTESLHRLDHLMESNADTKFVSFEPLLQDLAPRGGRTKVVTDEEDCVRTSDLFDIDWVIVGGESGPDYRSMQSEWVERLHGIVPGDTAWYYKQDSAYNNDVVENPHHDYCYREMPDGREPPEPIDDGHQATLGGGEAA